MAFRNSWRKTSFEGIAIRKIKFLAFGLIACGILVFIVGALLGGMDGDKPGMYFGPVGLILFATGLGVLIVWLIVRGLSSWSAH